VGPEFFGEEIPRGVYLSLVMLAEKTSGKGEEAKRVLEVVVKGRRNKVLAVKYAKAAMGLLA